MSSQEILEEYSKSVIVKNANRCMQIFKFDRFRELADKRKIQGIFGLDEEESEKFMNFFFNVGEFKKDPSGNDDDDE
ncbi:hypothetical protein M0812_20014 [Anaeramoeba flamelloides]|uniref:Uncharacterized protein n=1 Tax=Anaeramoeba flamelloides TaxID=1746091 RepID=A0AAV7YYW3_9EUKA|nr:hypothetical protein M0812_20014 [Anaeramoeba flamelloides]